MTCPKCSRDAAEGCIICPYCLSQLDSSSGNSVKKKRGWIAVLAISAAVVIAAAVLFFFAGCASSSYEASAYDDQSDGVDFAGIEWYEDGSFAVIDSDPTLYAGSPIVGTWVLLVDYEDGYDDRDNIAEYTSDGYVYEWYGDGMGYYNPLCAYDYDGDTLIYHYFTDLGAPENYDAVFSCVIDGDRMTTTDRQGISSQFIRISSDINLSVDEVEALYPQE